MKAVPDSGSRLEIQRPRASRHAAPGLARRASAGLTFAVAVIVAAVALAVPGAARAENECGPPQAGTPVVCSASNYDAAADGNIVYRTREVGGGDFTIRLADGLSIRYDRHDPDDDRLVFSDGATPLYSAVRIETDADHTGDISLFSSADVTSNARGISVAHYGESGAMRTEIEGGSFSIASDWSRAFAIHSFRGDRYDTNDAFSGDQDVIVRGVLVDVEGGWAGIIGSQGVDGDLTVAVQDSDIEVDARWATGVFGSHRGAGDVDIDVRNVKLHVGGRRSIDGIRGYHRGSGRTNVAVRDSTIDVRAESNGASGISFLYSRGEGGDLSYDIRDVDIDVSSVHGIYRMHENAEGGRYFDGIWGGYWGDEGNIRVDVRRTNVVTRGADSGGMSFIHDRNGDIDIAARNVRIEVEGDRSTAIGGGQRHEGTGDIAIDVRDSTLAATGESVAGIRAFNFTGDGRIDIRVDGGTVEAEGLGSSGILVGLTGRLFENRTEPIEAPALRDVEVDPSDNTRRPAAAQEVHVNGRVWGGTGVGAGVRLYGGGRVEIGPRGSVGADSGVAVRAEGDGATLHVGVALDGRRPGEAIAGGIRNDDGRTTIVVDGTILHDGMTGATGLRAPLGARDVTLAASATVAGRAFAPADFAVSWAPRAAVYEALPGFLLRLDRPGSAGGRAAALLGIDPYEVPDAVAAAIISFWDGVDSSIREDALASASEESLAAVRQWLNRTFAALADSESGSDWNQLRQTLSASATGAPWTRGYKLARCARSELGVGEGRFEFDVRGALALWHSEQKPPSTRIHGLVAADAPACVTAPRGESGKRFLLARALGDYLDRPEPSAGILSSLVTDRQAQSRAFAAEFLAPAASLRAVLGDVNLVEPEQVDDLGRRFGVAGEVIRRQIGNHNLASVAQV